ncbi:MAG: phasin family protein [Acidobacteriota bacterium]
MTEQFKTDDLQKVSKEGFDAAVRVYSETSRGWQAIATELAAYFKTVFENATANFEKSIGVKSIEEAIEIQSQYAKKAYADHIAQVTKLTEIYVSLACSAYSPVEKTVAKKA